MRRVRARRIGIEGLTIGHSTDLVGKTGLTVFLVEEGAVAGADLRGSATGTRQVDSLDPCHIVPRVQGVLLAGGSGFGLSAAEGVCRHLEERGLGFPVPAGVVPIVPTAILYDLSFGDSRARPTAAMAYEACSAASGAWPAEGSVGAGTGATVGKLEGIACAMKGGFGLAQVRAPDGLVVLAAAAVNSFGDVVDFETGEILAGTRRSARSLKLADSSRLLLGHSTAPAPTATNTTLAVVATNAQITKPLATKVAMMASGGIVRSIRPALTLADGDVVFALSTDRVSADPNRVGHLAEIAVARAIRRAVTQADGFGILPAHGDI